MSVPPPLPLAGHLPWFLADKLGFLTRAARDAVGPVPLRTPGPTWLLTEPEDVRFVLEGAADRFEKSRFFTTRRGRRLLGEGLHTASAHDHRRLRRDLNPLFHHRAVDRHMAAVLEATDGRLATWTDGAVVPAAPEMFRLLLDALGRQMFADAWSPELAKAMVDRRAYIHYFIRSGLPFAPYLPLPVVARYRRAEARLRAAIAAGLDAGRRDPERPDFLSALASLRDASDRPLPEARLTDEALTLSVTGFETLADGLAWALHLLATHPGIQDAVVAEVDRVVGRSAPTPDQLGRLEYTGRVLAETLRLYPPTWLFLRVPRQEERLPGGTVVAAGDKLYVCPWVLGRDPRHFPEPHRFDPDRFTLEARSARPRVSYIPFGFGPRTCIGRHLANREGLLILARIARRFRFRAAYDGDPTPRPGITLSPAGPVPIRLSSRGSGPSA